MFFYGYSKHSHNYPLIHVVVSSGGDKLPTGECLYNSFIIGRGSLAFYLG